MNFSPPGFGLLIKCKFSGIKHILKSRKKILSIFIKIIIGLGSLTIIYLRLKSDFSPDKLDLLLSSATSREGMFLFLFCILLIPLNWGIEAYKWQLITKPVEYISYRRATRSVYSGVCLGNLAPARATEFLAKIIFFHISNRPKITVLHFIGGMFQLSVTLIAGFTALIYQIGNFGSGYSWMIRSTGVIGGLLLLTLIVAIFKIDSLLNYFSKKISKDNGTAELPYRFTAGSLSQLFGFSILRYMVFFVQFLLVLWMFNGISVNSATLSGIAMYFLVTTTLPMISVLEAAIRAAVALVVFRGAGVSDTVLALSSVLIWLCNIIVPAIIGYAILLRQNFNFKLFRSK
jgi:hypothetical protein